jgi:hypothetical protein
MDSATEQQSQMRIEFLEVAPRENDLQVVCSTEELLSPAKGLMVGIAIGLAFWLLLGVLVYVFLI